MTPDTLEAVEIGGDLRGEMPANVEAFLLDAQARIDVFFEAWQRSPQLGFFASDYAQLFPVLRRLKRMLGSRSRLCEWGSGFGVVVGLGALLGYEACGIEIDERLVLASRRLLEDHSIEATIVHGSFIPAAFRLGPDDAYSPRVRTRFGGGEKLPPVDVRTDEFDVIFAFPWPGEEDIYARIFTNTAASGSLLVTYDVERGVRVQRKSVPQK